MNLAGILAGILAFLQQARNELEVVRGLLPLLPLPAEVQKFLSDFIAQIEALTEENEQLAAKAVLVSFLKAELAKVGVNL